MHNIRLSDMGPRILRGLSVAKNDVISLVQMQDFWKYYDIAYFIMEMDKKAENLNSFFGCY